MTSRTSSNAPSVRQRKALSKVQLQRQLSVGKRSSTSFGKSIQAPVAIATATRTSAPRVAGSFNSTRIRHREMIGTVTGSTTFSSKQFALNPGNSNTFPWLSTQAPSWEMYRFHKLKFEYVSRTSTTTVGVVLLVVDYDAGDSAPTTETIACAYQGTIAESPWVPTFSQVLQPNRMHPSGPKYIRVGSSYPVGQDVKTLDVGNFFLCTNDFASAAACGKLWVEYDVELMVPHLPPTGSSLAGSARLSTTAVSNVSILSGAAFNTVGDLSLTTGGNTITFNSIGEFLILLYFEGTGLNNATVSSSTLVFTKDFDSSAGTISSIRIRVQVVNPGSVITISMASSTSVSKTCAIVTDYAYSLGPLI